MSENPTSKYPLLDGCHRITLDSPEDFLDWRQGSGTTIEIYNIQVDSSRREGKGTRLLEKLFKHFKEHGGHRQVFAITRADNLIAQLFYEKKQFHVSGVLRQFYSPGERTVDAILYCRHSSGPV